MEDASASWDGLSYTVAANNPHISGTSNHKGVFHYHAAGAPGRDFARVSAPRHPRSVHGRRRLRPWIVAGGRIQ